MSEIWERIERAGLAKNEVLHRLRVAKQIHGVSSATDSASREQVLEQEMRGVCRRIESFIRQVEGEQSAIPPDVMDDLDELADIAELVQLKLRRLSVSFPDAPSDVLGERGAAFLNHWAVFQDLREGADLTWPDCAVLWSEFEKDDESYEEGVLFWERRETRIEATAKALNKAWTRTQSAARALQSETNASPASLPVVHHDLERESAAEVTRAKRRLRKRSQERRKKRTQDE